MVTGQELPMGRADVYRWSQPACSYEDGHPQCPRPAGELPYGDGDRAGEEVRRD